MIRFWLDGDLKEIEKMHSENFVDAWNYDMLRTSFLSDGFLGVLISEDGEILSTLSYNIVLDEAEMLHVVTKQSARKLGLAEKLITHSISLLKDRGVKQVFLEVRKSNKSAINLYRKCGFSEIAERKNYYGKETAIILKREI